MTQETTTPARRIKPGAVLTALGAAALAGLTALLALYNAAGWLDRQFPLLAALAVTTEAIAFLMAVCAELAWGRGGHWLVRVARVACCLIILAGSEAFNAAGSHEAWRGTMERRAETLTEPQRNALQNEEARLSAAVVEARAGIEAVQQPDLSGGPLNDAQAIAAWEALTAPNRQALAAAEAALNGLDREIEHPEAPFPAEIVWAFLAFLGFVKVAGLWAIGVAFFRPANAERNEAVTIAAVSGTQEGSVGNGGGNVVVALPTGAARIEAVRALRQAGLSFGEIERRYGVRKGTSHRWCT